MMIDLPGCYGCATPFTGLQAWMSHHLRGHAAVLMVMNSRYGWHACETLHFFGLSLLVGTIGVFDMRVLGMAKRIPIASLRQLQPWGVGGFLVNAITGLMFLMTLPDQYLYQWPFWFKIAFMLLAGINAVIFNLVLLGKVETLGHGDDAPAAAKIMCAASLCLWIGVIFAGRFLAFYKPVFTGSTP